MTTGHAGTAWSPKEDAAAVAVAGKRRPVRHPRLVRGRLGRVRHRDRGRVERASRVPGLPGNHIQFANRPPRHRPREVAFKEVDDERRREAVRAPRTGRGSVPAWPIPRSRRAQRPQRQCCCCLEFSHVATRNDAILPDRLTASSACLACGFTGRRPWPWASPSLFRTAAKFPTTA